MGSRVIHYADNLLYSEHALMVSPELGHESPKPVSIEGGGWGEGAAEPLDQLSGARLPVHIRLGGPSSLVG